MNPTMTDDIETIDHTRRFINVLNRLRNDSSTTIVDYMNALESEHEIVIRLHERLMLARMRAVVNEDYSERNEGHPGHPSNYGDS